MSKELQAKINELFEATKDLMTLEEIKPHCEHFNEWVNTNTSYGNDTLGTKLSAYGFYKKFKALPLEQGKNAEAVPKHDAEGNVKGHELKHYAILLCGLTKDQWNERNQTTRNIDRLENGSEIDPDSYLEVTGKLLASEDPHELAVGLIAATGRRPHEIIARAKFTAIKDKPYYVSFSGQAKKRGETPVFEIPTLYPAEYVIKALARLRKEPSTQALLKEVAAEFPKSQTRQNITIDNRRGQSLRRVVMQYFGDVGEKQPVLSVRHGDDRSNNKALRAAYAVLATERECQGSFAAKLLFASRILGHYTPKKEDDRALTKLATSTAYTDYYSKKPVAYPDAPKKATEKTHTIRATEADFEAVKRLQEQWGLSNQQAVLSRLLANESHRQSIERRLVEMENENLKLKEEIQTMQASEETPTQEMTQESTRIDQLESQVAELRNTLNEVLARLDKQPQTVAKSAIREVVESKPTERKKPIDKKQIDWESVPNEQLKNMRGEEALNEKIYRAFRAIADYNDNAPSNDDRWYIGSVSLAAVAGSNRGIVGDWIKNHQTTVDDHNNKYGLGQYHNKRHRNIDIIDVVKLWENPENFDRTDTEKLPTEEMSMVS